MQTLKIVGSAFDIGRQLGESGREAYQTKVRATPLWQRVQAQSSSDQARRLSAATQARFPAVWQELLGLAQGLEAPVQEVFAWNCRGDLLESTSDGCTTVFGRDGTGAIVVAHNEDGFPQLYDDCALVQVTGHDGVAFTSFAYPGSLCGHTFAVNAAGIVNTVNNIRARRRPGALPRQVLARAALNARTLDEALTVLTDSDRAGAFHHALAQAGMREIYSVEATGEGCEVRAITHSGGHANHLINTGHVAQLVTASSQARQQRLDAWFAAREGAALTEMDALAILSDSENAELPIYRRAPDDPDDENTLATVVFRLTPGNVSWRVWRRNRQIAALDGNVALPYAK